MVRKFADYFKLFTQFLAENGLTEAFYNNCNGAKVRTLLKNEDPCDFLCSIFLFENTPEGFWKWWGYHEMWWSFLADYGYVQE